MPPKARSKSKGRRPSKEEKKVEQKDEQISQGRPFAEKFFGSDLLASAGLALLKPQLRQDDLRELINGPPIAIGLKMLEIGKKLKQEGTFPGGHYIYEDSLEWDDSVDLLERALKEVSIGQMNFLVQKAAKQAEAGFGALGTWGPRLACLRWLCCIWWLAARVDVVNRNSVGAGIGSIDPRVSAQACYNAKHDMIQWINELIHLAPLLKVFDFDLLGHGVYMNQRAEPMPRHADNVWFRRQMEFDLASICHQVKELQPESLNLLEPKLTILRPYGEATWMLPPPDVCRVVLEKHGWVAVGQIPPIDEIPHKALVQGRVLHMDRPSEFEFDLKDPEIIARLQRGEKLGKGPQEEGLPGAIDGSLALLYAGVVGIEGYDNVKLYPDLLEVEDFLETFLKYVTRLSVLDLSQTEGVMDEEFLTFIPMCGSSLRILDLERTGLDSSHVDTLVDTCQALTGLQHLDVAHNKIDAPGTTLLLASFAERRIDLQTVRLDGNPLGDLHEFRQDIAGLLAARGDQVVAGGELVLHLDVNAVRWFSEPKADTLAARRRDDTLMMAATSFEELQQEAHVRNANLDRLYREGRDPRTRTLVGKEILEKERQLNTTLLNNPLLMMYRDKVEEDDDDGVEAAA